MGGADGTPSHEATPIPLGCKLEGKYHVQRVLGRGSMGVVYLGRDIRLERAIAIKVLLPRYAADERVAQRFRREAIAMASIRVDNVVQIFASGEYDAHPYFVMEYIPGYTVATLIDSANQRGELLYLDVVLGILRQVCRGLQAVHDGGIVHRDVKPPNMLVGPHFKVAITDFGLVETLQETGENRDMAGTPLYLAPELIMRQPLPDDQRHLSDIYALGVSAHEMLTGDVPFNGQTVKEILRRHLQDAPPRVSESRADLPAAVDDVILRAMHKDPTCRYGTCTAFMEALDQARSSHAQSVPRIESQRILIAEDDADARMIYATALKVGFPGAIIHNAADGVGALEIARYSTPDLVVVDLDIPGRTGIELCAALRDDEPTAHIPVVVITKHVSSELRLLLRDLRITEIMRKPVEVTDLVSLVRSQLRVQQ